MCSSWGPLSTVMIVPSRPRSSRGVTSLPSAADSQGKRAPRRPSRRATSSAAGRRRTRYSNMASTAAGRMAARAGGEERRRLKTRGLRRRPRSIPGPRPPPHRCRRPQRAGGAPRTAPVTPPASQRPVPSANTTVDRAHDLDVHPGVGCGIRVTSVPSGRRSARDGPRGADQSSQMSRTAMGTFVPTGPWGSPSE